MKPPSKVPISILPSFHFNTYCYSEQLKAFLVKTLKKYYKSRTKKIILQYNIYCGFP